MEDSKGNNCTSGCRLAKRLLGQILVDGEFISPQDLELALERQKNTNELLGDILVRMGLLDPLDLKVALSVQGDFASLEDAVKVAAGVRKLLGELLLQAKRITHEQLGLALQEQQRTGGKLGEVFVRLGFLTESELDAALTFQQHLADPTSKRFSLGEILISTNHITREQLEEALAHQSHANPEWRKLGKVLVEGGYVQPHHINHALNLQHKLVAAALVATLSLASMRSSEAAQSVESGAGSSSSTITVTAIVDARANLKIVHQPSELIVTNEDILRGYLDVPATSRIEIKSNSPAGYLLAFEGLGGPFKEVHINGFGRDVQIVSMSGLVSQPYSQGTVAFDLSYRFVLSEDPQPGTYAWPLTISIIPR